MILVEETARARAGRQDHTRGLGSEVSAGEGGHLVSCSPEDQEARASGLQMQGCEW